MADAKKAEAETAATPPKKKGKWMVFALIGVACLALGGGAAFFLLKKPAPTGDEATEAATKEPAKKKKAEPGAPPVFYKFDKAFTVKLQTEQQEAYLQAEVQLKLLDSQGLELMKQFEPELKHRITLTLMNNKASTLSTATGVQRLANELRDIANRVIDPTSQKAKPAADAKPATETSPATEAAAAPPADAADPGAPVQSVLFSSFIIQ
jgi:flagellar FliL protein